MTAREIPLPMVAYITPSKINDWRGAKRSADARFTAAQERWMREREIDPETVETLRVRSRASAREHYVNSFDEQPWYVFECPVVRRTGRKVLVVAPSGYERWVWEDGHIVQPKGYR